MRKNGRTCVLEKDDDEDEESLALASIGKHIKKSLNDAQVDAVLDELNEVAANQQLSAYAATTTVEAGHCI